MKETTTSLKTNGMPLSEWNVPFVEMEGAKKVTVKTSKVFQKLRGGRKGKMEAGGRFVRGRFILDPLGSSSIREAGSQKLGGRSTLRNMKANLMVLQR